MQEYLIWYLDENKWLAKAGAVDGKMYGLTDDITLAGQWTYHFATNECERRNKDLAKGETLKAVMMRVPEYPANRFRK